MHLSVSGLSCHSSASLPTCLRMNRGLLQFFFAALLVLTAAGQSIRLYRIVMTDVDGDRVSTCDGHVTIVTVTTRSNETKAHQVGDCVSNRYLGDAHYRLITVVNFQKQINSLFRPVASTIMRARLDSEAKRIQPIYGAKHLSRNPRQDLFAVADFDGTVTSAFGISSASDEFAVFLFDRRGHLLRRWRDVPPREELAAALAAAL